MKARFILNKSKLIENYNIIKEYCDTISYSLKTNPTVAQVLEENTDSWFSVHFVNSLDFVKDKSKVWFLGHSLTTETLDTVFEKGVRSFIIDNETDLNTFLNYIEGKNQKVNLLLRMRMKEHTIHTGKYFVFGMYSKKINELIPVLRKNPNIEKLGIHFHRKSQNMSEWSIKDELKDVLEESTLKQIDIVNIGGGIPVKYKNHDVDVLPYVFSKLKELKEWLNLEYGAQMIIEAGRFLAGPCIKLETEITNIFYNDVVINCSVYNAAMDTFVTHIRLLIEGELDNGASYTIKGLTPDSMDVFRYKVYLDNPQVGDKIVFLNAGAYTYSTDFCNLEKLDTVIVE